MLARLSKPVCALASTLILSSCLHLQLGGGIASATLTVTPLRDPTQILQQVESPSQQDLLEAFHGTVSLPFEAGDNARVAVKIVDDRGIESLKIVALD